ncbi:unnamed protein product [Coccothraustes coccothraustes]
MWKNCSVFECWVVEMGKQENEKAGTGRPIRSPLSHLFSRLNKPNSLTLSSQEKCSIPLIILVSFLCTHSNSSLLFLLGTPELMQHCRWALTRAEQSRAEQRGRIPSLALLPTLLWMQPRTPLAL